MGFPSPYSISLVPSIQNFHSSPGRSTIDLGIPGMPLVLGSQKSMMWSPCEVGNDHDSTLCVDYLPRPEVV